MNRKTMLCRLTAGIIIITIVIFTSAGNIYAKENENLPTLIQATTLEEDYRALAKLELAVTPLLLEEDWERAFENILCSCVRIQTREHYGSGSIYKMKENEIIIVTNRHVLEDFDDDSHVTFFNGAVGFGEILGTSDLADVGFISISTASFPWEELLVFRNVRPLDTEREGGGQKGLWQGNGADESIRFFCPDMANYFETPVMKSGELLPQAVYLEDFGMEMLYGTGSAAPGMSGSGVFDGCGNYLGMLTGATGAGEIAAVPLEVVRREYEEMN